MIRTQIEAAGLAGRLTAKARLLAEARFARRADPLRWRRAAWLWPLFTKDR
jgi:hypothetical protein